MRTFEINFLMFITLSIAGWLMETACKSIEYRRFINRGFLIGPYCPVYGVGAMLVMQLLAGYSDSPFTVFIMAMLICGCVEYLTGYVMEKLFHARWWDYSNRRFNLNGRICLDTLVSFGLLSLLCVYFIEPFLIDIYTAMPDKALHMLCAPLMLIFTSDIAVSAKILLRIRSTSECTAADSTEKLTQAVRRELSKKSRLVRRTFRAFPYARLHNNFFSERLREKQRILKDEFKRIKDSIRNSMPE